MAKAWMDSSDIVSAIKRKIAFPVAENTFSTTDILAFVNEEMMISQVPSVLQYHEEYFVTRLSVPLISNISRYPIPDRAIGMKLRDLFWADASGNLFEMTRINSEDKAFYQTAIGANQAIHKYYVEGNDIVLTPTLIVNPTGSLVFFFFLRPNQLVATDTVATVSSFFKNITLDNAFLSSGDTITIDDVLFTAVSGSPSTNQFQIGGTSAISTTNFIAAINLNGTVGTAVAGSSSNIAKITYTDVTQTFTTNDSSAFSIQATISIQFSDTIPDNFAEGDLIDFLQTKPGHTIRAYDIEIPTGGMVGTTITFDSDNIPTTLVVGDYIASAGECVIPGIPPDLHTLLAEKASARILASLGDAAGLEMQNAKIKEAEYNQGMILDDRVEGSVLKIAPKHSLIRYGKMGTRRRL